MDRSVWTTWLQLMPKGAKCFANEKMRRDYYCPLLNNPLVRAMKMALSCKLAIDQAEGMKEGEVRRNKTPSRNTKTFGHFGHCVHES